MKKKLAVLVLMIIFMITNMQISSAAEDTWRSSLYPIDWQPGYKDAEGRFLHDFSYAGYHKGEKEIPENPPGEVYDVSKAPYFADKTGNSDATAAIQDAIDDAQEAGGGVVYLPAGTYRVSPPEGRNEVLNITGSNIVIKGDGPSATFIYNDDPFMRQKTIIRIAPGTLADWYALEERNTVSITADLPELTSVLPVSSVEGYHVGDWVMVRTDCTAAFIAEHGVTGKWTSAVGGMIFYRQIVDMDAVHNTMTIDIPLRYWMKTRDNARVYKVDAHISENGIQDLSFGMLENTKADTGEEAYNTVDTAAYECHGSYLIRFVHSINGWVKNVETYKPSENTKNVHILSNGIILASSRNITVDSCNMQLPLYEGGGGNGYLFTIQAQECLIINCYAYHGRHNYDFGKMTTSGNVVTSSKTISGTKESDFHMHLSPALFDNMYVSGNQLEGINRNEYGSTNKHGQTTTQSVFWNTYGNSYQSGESSIVESQQFGMGYVIGTQGPAYKVLAIGGDSTEPIDFVEGEGTAAALEPQSLYQDQLARRLGAYRGPRVKQTFPQNGNKLFVNSSAWVDFDSDMDFDSITDPSNITVEPYVNYQLTYDASQKRCLISFPDGLVSGTEYRITLKEGLVKSADGEALIADKVFTFTATAEQCEASAIQLLVGCNAARGDISITNHMSVPMNPALFVGLYQKHNNKLIRMTTKQAPIEPGSTAWIQSDMLDVPQGLSDYYFKAFVWDGYLSLTPFVLPVQRDGDQLSNMTIYPIADSYTRNGTYSTVNYGSSESLELKNGSSNFYRKVYFKFDLSSSMGLVRRAKLRVYGANTTAGGSVDVSTYLITNDNWQEDTIAWSNAPAMSTLIGRFTIGDVKQYYELDVTSYVLEQLANDKMISFGLDTTSGLYTSIGSRESENKPELVLEY